MAYNEADLLPVWLRHHAAQVGLAHCYVLDHGSTDATARLAAGANILHLPRTPLDEEQRCAFVSDFCAALLHWYDAVAYADTDELLLADPARHDGLVSLSRSLTAPVTTAFGFNVVHRLGVEAPLSTAAPVSRQRSWFMPTASLCKPALITRPVRWVPGFHAADAPIVFGDLLLAHLAFADEQLTIRRHRRRMAVPRANPDENPHHQVDGDTVLRWMRGWSALAEVEGVGLGPDCPQRTAFQARLLASCAGREAERYRSDISLVDYRLWRLPERFRGAF